MNFTDEQFNALAPFEPKFETLTRAHYVSYVGFRNAKRIDEILKAAGLVPATQRTNYACADCVKRLVAKAGAAWYADKLARAVAEREKEAARATAEAVEDAPKPKPAPKFIKTDKAPKTAQKSKSAKK